MTTSIDPLVLADSVQLLRDQQCIVGALAAALESLGATNTISNLRTQVDGDRAHSVVIVCAPVGGCSVAGDELRRERCYDVDLVRDGARWAVEDIVVRSNSNLDGPPMPCDHVLPTRRSRAIGERPAVPAHTQ